MSLADQLRARAARLGLGPEAADALVTAELARIDRTAGVLLRLEKERRAVLARERLGATWPLELARERAAPVPSDEAIAEAAMRWPADVSAEDVARALEAIARGHELAPLAREIASDLRAEKIAAAVRYAESPLAPEACAVLVSVLKEVRADQERRLIAIDAGRPHHEFLTGTMRAAARGALEIESTSGGSWALRFPERPGIAQATKLQLALFDATGDSPSETLLAGIRQWRSAFGVRNWIVLQKLLSDAGRSGTVFWRVEDHLDALGMSASWRTRPENREKVIDEVRALASIELVYEHEKKEHRLRGRLFQPGPEYDIRRGAAWELEGIELMIHPSLYSGVRARDGSLGRNFWPLPSELATLDHERFGPALALGPILAIRFRWESHQSDAPELRIGAAKLVELAGIALEREGRGHTRRVLAALDANLQELVRIGVLGSAIWEKPGDLRSIVVLRPSPVSLDRVVHGLLPTSDAHPKLLAGLPTTGSQLAAWRKSRGLTQRTLAAELKVGERSLKRGEAAAEERLPRAIERALHERYGTGPLEGPTWGQEYAADPAGEGGTPRGQKYAADPARGAKNTQPTPQKGPKTRSRPRRQPAK